jgi:hypothetical protein
MRGNLAMIDYDYHHAVLRLGSPLLVALLYFSSIGKRMTHVGWIRLCATNASNQSKPCPVTVR